MMRARGRALIALIAMALAGAALALAARYRDSAAPRAEGERPRLLLLTSLPLLFAEEFSLEAGGSDALRQLQSRYRVVPISTSAAAELGKDRLLLMAQPPAQTPENLVALDQWVRGGGRLLLLADPYLEWPSKRPLGDPLRPPPMFADTGLLGHWGLRLDAPDEHGPKLRQLGGREIQAVSPGALFGNCAVSSDRLVARCKLGTGRAVVVADADFLNLPNMDGPVSGNLPALLAELAGLENGARPESH